MAELVLGPGLTLVPGGGRYLITFIRPVSHAITEEFPAVLAEWVRGGDQGFLRRVENEDLVVAMGLREDQFRSLQAYALITAHEVLVVFCGQEPSVKTKDSQYLK